MVRRPSNRHAAHEVDQTGLGRAVGRVVGRDRGALAVEGDRASKRLLIIELDSLDAAQGRKGLSAPRGTRLSEGSATRPPFQRCVAEGRDKIASVENVPDRMLGRLAHDWRPGALTNPSSSSRRKSAL